MRSLASSLPVAHRGSTPGSPRWTSMRPPLFVLLGILAVQLLILWALAPNFTTFRSYSSVQEALDVQNALHLTAESTTVVASTPNVSKLTAELEALQRQNAQLLRTISAQNVRVTQQQQAQLEQEQQQEQQQQAEPTPASTQSPLLAALPQLTQLHNEFLKSHHGNFKQSNQYALELLQRFIRDGPEEVAKLHNAGGSLEQFLAQLYSLVHSSGHLIPCRVDDTLQLEDQLLLAPKQHTTHSDPNAINQQQARKYFFAANLHSNAKVAPHFVFSLLQTLLTLSHDNVFVSIFESNSDDNTDTWLDILKLVLDVIGVPAVVESRGPLVRHSGQARIEFLSTVRNTALQPLYDYYATNGSR